nr:CRISPR-associated endoribonuclease Cas6 [Lunatimonas salinarum]
MIDSADSDFSEFLHGAGYAAFGKKYRLFVFSRLKFDQCQVIKGSDRMVHEGRKAWFEISFLIDRAAEGFIRGLFLDQGLEIGDRSGSVAYTVTQVAGQQPVLFSEWMTYRCLSPIFIRRKRPEGGEDYLHPGERDFWILLVRNLTAKQQALALASAEGDSLNSCLPNFDYRILGKVYKNGVTIKQQTARETKLIGYTFRFSLCLPTELHEIGYYAGFGHLGSQGFGCVEVKGGDV